MHELTLAEQTLDMALEVAREQHASRIEELKLRVGPLSGVVDEALEFALASLTPGTMAAGARVSIVHVPLVCFCHHCHHPFESMTLSYRCPDCGEPSADIRQGREMDLVSIEVS